MQDKQSISHYLNLRQIEPFIGLALLCHGILMLSHFGFKTGHIIAIFAVMLISFTGFIPYFQHQKWIQARAISLSLITAYLIFYTGGSNSFFLLWFFVIASYYPLILGKSCGISLISFLAIFYLSTLFFTVSKIPEIIVLARTFLLTFLGILSYNLSKRLRAFDKMEKLAHTDSLTGLNNRRYFFELAEKEFNRNKRYDSKLCLVIIDIDSFKQINDTYGHIIGDQALKLCATLLLKNTRDIDIVCRIGGDEFAILLPSTDHTGAAETIERLKLGLQNELIPSKEAKIYITASFGIAEYSRSTIDIKSLYDQADQDMYKNKKQNQISNTPRPPIHT